MGAIAKACSRDSGNFSRNPEGIKSNGGGEQ